MVAFIDQHPEPYGVEPICAVLPIAPSNYFLQKAQDRAPTTRSAGAQRDEELRAAIQRVWDEHQQGYGPRKVWRQLRREVHGVALVGIEIPTTPLTGGPPSTRMAFFDESKLR